LYTNTTGNYNVGVGDSSLYYCTSGNTNTAIGHSAGTGVTTGSNNTFIGYNAEPLDGTDSNIITLGNASIASLRCQVTSITGLSDARDKKDIMPITAGLDFVEQLKPVSFTWNMRNGGKVNVLDTGFIAQDLQQVQIDTGVKIPGLVYEANPEHLEASYGKLLPVLVKAIQELKKELDDLKATIVVA
jgi:hypothetical protein